MTISNTQIKVSETDFDTLKNSLKQFLQSQEELLDYDFESSTINTLLDLLAYNTYHNAFYNNMIGNEMFLESASRRENVVSRAKQLNYIPSSVKGSRAELDVTINPNDNPDSITISKNEQFTADLDGITYTFVVPETQIITANTSGGFETTLEIVEGEPLTHRYTVSSSNPVRYVIPNPSVDTDSLLVRVQASSSDTSKDNFVGSTDVTEIDGSSKVYFLEENADGNYELKFGDGVLGTSLKNGNIVIINYRVASGSETNGIGVFSGPSTLGGYSDFNFTVSLKSHSGSDRESIASIKRNAPKNFEAQSRTVTSSDYSQLVRSKFNYIQSVNAWGGEENSPPTFGTVFISAKPKEGVLLSQSQKNDILEEISRFNILTIGTEFVDPLFLYINPTIKAFYNPQTSDSSAGQIRDDIAQNVIDFESDNLETFENKKFRYSNFVNSVDDSNDGIVSNLTTISMSKRFVPDTTASTNYKINFNNEIKRPVSSTHEVHEGGHFISSSAFQFEGNRCFFDDDGEGTLRIYTVSGGNIVYLNRDAGDVDYTTGLISIDSIQFESFEGDYLEIEATPEINNISAVRNQILLIGSTLIEVVDESTQRVIASTRNVTTTGVETPVVETGITSTVI